MMLIQSMKYKALAAFMALSALCAGCHHSDDPCPPDDATAPDMVTLCLDVSFDGQQKSTRADLGDNDRYEDPSGDFEKIETLRVIIIHDTIIGDKTYKHVEANRLVKTNSDGVPLNDNLEFKVTANEQKRIYLVANEGSLSAPNGTAPMSYSTAKAFLDSYEVGKICDPKYLADWTVSFPGLSADTETVSGGLFTSSENPRLPLTEFFDVYVNRDKAVDQERFYSHLFMTRAAAKASFVLDKAATNIEAYQHVTITSLSLYGVGSEEYVFPRDTQYSKGKYQGPQDATVTESGKLDLDMYITTFTPPTGCRALTYVMNPDFKMDGSSEAIAGPIYFPESILDNNKQYEVGVQLSTGEYLTAPLITNILSLKKDGTDRDAVARNTHLKIMLTFTKKELNCEVVLVPYIGVKLEPVFGLDS